MHEIICPHCRKAFKTDAARVAFLFERYQQITSLLPAAKAGKTRKPKIKPAQAEA